MVGGGRNHAPKELWRAACVSHGSHRPELM
jgi:hypothetical protein